MKIIPALDLLRGRVVTLVGGVPGTQTHERERPLAVLQEWVDAGAEWIHIVNLDAALGEGDAGALVATLLQTRAARFQVGGGVRTGQDIQRLLGLGADRVVVGTRALKDPAWFADQAHANPGRLILALDTRDGNVTTDGWKSVSTQRGEDVASRARPLPLAAVLHTSINVEGRLQGMDRPLIEKIARATRHPLQVAGGVTSYEDLQFLLRLGADAAILGAALYEGRIQLPEALRLAHQV